MNIQRIYVDIFGIILTLWSIPNYNQLITATSFAFSNVVL